MKILSFRILVILLNFCRIGHCANILFYFRISGYSHISSLWNVMEALAEDGHNVTLLTSLSPKVTNPRVHVIHAREIHDVFIDQWDEGGDLIQARLNDVHQHFWDIIHENALLACEAFLNSPAAQNLIHNSGFDLVVIDSAFNECGIGLAYHKYKCPFIIYSAVSFFQHYHGDFGLPIEASSIPDIQIAYKTSMSFYERLVSAWKPIYWIFAKNWYYYPALAAMLKDSLNLDVSPDFNDLTTKASLVLVNSHYSNDYARSLPPLFVQVAGMQISDKRKPIPEELEKFISTPGCHEFIYVSFGTAVRISKSNSELRDKFFAALGNVTSVQFVWKWEGDLPKIGDYPDNIYFSKWLPQQDLFAHKSIIGHGGSNGIHEATHYGVPMIVFPVFGDQDYNANSVGSKELGIVMEITSFAQGELEANIQELLTNKEFHKRVARAKAFKDRPMSPLGTATWWIEYVLRNENTNYLMPLSANQPWFVRWLLDIWLFTLLILTTMAVCTILVLYKILSLLRPRNSTKDNPRTYNYNGINGYKNHEKLK